MLKSVIFLTTSDSLKEKCDNPPTTEHVILVRELKTELEDPHLVNMAQHRDYRMMPTEITLGDQLTKCTGNNKGRRLKKGVEERGIFFVSFSTPLCLLCPSRFSCMGCIV